MTERIHCPLGPAFELSAALCAIRWLEFLKCARAGRIGSDLCPSPADPHNRHDRLCLSLVSADSLFLCRSPGPSADQHMKRAEGAWDDLAELDPLWAILSDPGKKFGRWNAEAFFATGVEEIERALQMVHHHDLPRKNGRALDFGCGVGRLTRALSEQFSEVYGIDASEKMIDLAKNFNSRAPNCTFLVNRGPNLRVFSDGFFDFVYSALVLQHLRQRSRIERFVSEFVRVLNADGVAVFQLPSPLSAKHRVQPRQRLYRLLRTIGLSGHFLYKGLGLHPISMTFISVPRVCKIVAKAGGRVLDIRSQLIKPVVSTFYVVSKT